MKPYTDLEWRKQLYTLRYILQLKFAKNDLSYMNYLAPYIEKFAKEYAQKQVTEGKYKTIEDAYDDYPLYKLRGVYALTMRVALYDFEDGLKEVQNTADYSKIYDGVNALGQRGENWNLNERDWMTLEEQKKFYMRPNGMGKGMDSDIFSITMGGGGLIMGV